jgi:hypothetical protein
MTDRAMVDDTALQYTRSLYIQTVAKNITCKRILVLVKMLDIAIDVFDILSFCFTNSQCLSVSVLKSLLLITCFALFTDTFSLT